MQLRLDQTVTFTVAWKDSAGHSVNAPAGVTPYVGDPNYVSVEDLGAGTYKVTPKALVDGELVGVSAPFGSVTDTVAVSGGAATSGTIVWGTPEPA